MDPVARRVALIDGASGFTQSICQIDRAMNALDAFETFCANPGPVAICAVGGASCFGPDGVSDTKSAMESEYRNRHIGWATNAKVKHVTQDAISVEEVDENGATRTTQELPSGFSMLLPAFRGVPACPEIFGEIFDIGELKAVERSRMTREHLTNQPSR